MPTALFVLVFVSVIPYVLAGLGGYAKVQQLGHLDNHHPRLQERKLSGRAARIIAAQSNAWEALAFYTATILAVSLSGVPWSDLSMSAIIFAITRMAHPVMYIADIAIGRTFVVIVGVTSCIYMLSLAF
ncbi:MAPEG family protein [Vibrio campbellii]|uniref:MAPEG family protein n=1 Tax=Vibrio campbellii TaxID=680 RepID=UPI0005EF614A|nr:MAPEG family protein [Vibrio campbellii]MCC8254336.1 MAPEG family protein [Vibrio campbellii CAIM 333]